MGVLWWLEPLQVLRAQGLKTVLLGRPGFDLVVSEAKSTWFGGMPNETVGKK